jgi:hypothetical protein
MTDRSAMALRTGNWGPLLYELGPHSPVTVELAPDDRPGVLVRFLDGLPDVPRELTAADVAELVVAAPSGRSRLRLTVPTGSVEWQHVLTGEGAWELRIECTGQRSLHLYSLTGTPFPSDADLESLASAVVPAG